MNDLIPDTEKSLSIKNSIDTLSLHNGILLMIEDISSEKRMKSTMSRYMDPGIADKLLEDDVILSIDGESIASDGTVKFRENERIPWRYLYRRKNVGENVSVEILRKNESVFVIKDQ